MKKILSILAVVALAGTLAYAAPTRLPNGLSLATETQETASGATMGAGDLLVNDDVTVVGSIVNTGNDYVTYAGTETWHKVMISTYMIDTADYNVTVASGKIGYGNLQVLGNDASATFSFTAAGVVTLSSATVHMGNATTTNGNDTTLNIYDAGTYIAIENQLGSSLIVVGEIFYKD